MISYTGKTCFSCGGVFDENDDIVVCPECGTPYHRDCYKKTGCTNTRLHEEHGSWQSDEDSTTTLRCPNCGTVLRNDARFCDHCGISVDQSQYRPVNQYRPANITHAVPGTPHYERAADIENALEPDPAEMVDENVSIGDLSEFVGTNKQYYIPRFSFMHKFNMKISFNLGAFFFPEAYFAYRRMIVPAIVVYVLRFVILMPLMAQTLSTLLADSQYYQMFREMLVSFPALLPALDVFASLGSSDNVSPTAQMIAGLSTLSSLMNMIVEMGVCLFANSIYYRFCIQSVKALKTSGNGDLIRMAGGISIPGLITFLILEVVRIYASIFILLSVIS